ncbi:MAG: argininosuccinate synthase [Omnitrophica WOR_2 bacterium RIFCSPLOWO2_12_FULL_51_24]|nr:MAG: argininosuccinate synthase [Omnitrophica WOR_2 bacterium RIFCSPHIGHO2_01_FULL_49_10]OGX43815.1 MAG: argininosuccinate synthase [Omnitrophica WOR_2 bacterium RIFCSPLOWO2_12_FULL_51_24]
MDKKVVLAYSGGLDTSVIIKWLTKKGYDVIAYMADVGQACPPFRRGSDFEVYKKRALTTGAVKVVVEDLKKEFVKDFVFKSLKAGAVYEGGYLLATALSRPIIAKGLVETAHKEKAGFVAHGCTGKGNDQVRFEVSIGALAPDLKILAPVREWELRTRAEEIDYAKKNNIPIDTTKKKPYSIDLNLWGISIESGKLEDPYYAPDEDIYQLTKGVDKAAAEPVYVEIEFKGGVPVKLNGRAMDGVSLILKLSKIAGDAGVGRSDMIENRLVGIKSREIYEAPAAWTLFSAHKALESLVFDREVLHFKEAVSLKYAELTYYGLWYTPLKEALDKFVDETQKSVNGTVKVKLHKGHCIVVGRKSPDSLYKKELATYEEGDVFDQSLAKGFVQIWGLPYKGLYKGSKK